MNDSKKFFIDADIICVKRKLDAKKIYEYLKQSGYEQVFNPKKADIIVLVTCAVFEQNTIISLEKVKKYKRYKAELIVAGCLPEIDKEKLKKIFNGKSISTKEINNIGDFFNHGLNDFSSINDGNLLFNTIIKNFSIKKWLHAKSWRLIAFYIKHMCNKESTIYKIYTEKRYYIRVSWGCASNCSYCAIKKAVGGLKSKTIEECVNEIKRGLENEYNFFVLTGDDVGAYGIDIGSNLSKLLDELTNIPGKYEISITDLNPWWIIRYFDDLVEILKRGKIIHMNIPFQSGNARILKLMKRYDDINIITNTYQKLRKMFPEIAISTQNIVGFPTETEEEFMETLFLIKNIGFDFGAIYSFSLRSGTPAFTIEPKVSKDEIIRRLRYSKKYLKKNGFNVAYKSIFLPYDFNKNLAFVKKQTKN